MTSDADLLPALLLALVVGLAAAAGLATPAAATTLRVDLGDGHAAALTDDLEIYLEAPPLRGEGLLAFSRRFTGTNATATAVARANSRPRRLLAGVRYRVPFEVLLDTWKARLVGALFPGDEARAAGWYHLVPPGGAGHSLWRISVWFTGTGTNWSRLREENRLGDETVPPGRGVLIPASLLLPIFRAGLPPLEAPRSAEYTYERDAGGEYLVYRLERGEALYSSVVTRFTGRAFAADVNALAREIAEVSGIRDVRDMPVGQRVRVPFDLLLPEYLPPGDPRRQDWDRARTEREQYSNSARSTTLEGITVILDAGHGGQDPGTLQAGVWESVYVYDIMLRTRSILASRTAATVVTTTRDGDGFAIPDRDQLPRSGGHEVLTDPPYSIGDTTVGTHLRWYLANSVHRGAVKRSGDPQKTVFISLHADALHASVRGAMAYIPATSLTRGEYGKSGTVYTKRREVREKQRVSFSWKERVKSEGLSRQLARELIASFRRHDLAVHNEKAIRDQIVRCRRCRPWVPAVVRYNAVPAKLLFEVANLSNREDRRLVQTRAFRQRVAEAIVDGILAYYGES